MNADYYDLSMINTIIWRGAVVYLSACFVPRANFLLAFFALDRCLKGNGNESFAAGGKWP